MTRTYLKPYVHGSIEGFLVYTKRSLAPRYFCRRHETALAIRALLQRSAPHADVLALIISEYPMLSVRAA